MTKYHYILSSHAEKDTLHNYLAEATCMRTLVTSTTEAMPIQAAHKREAGADTIHAGVQ
jgi:hypothetical protein